MFRTRDRKLDRLASLPLLEGATPRELRTVGALGDFVTLPAGAALARQGGWGRQALVVVAGSATATYADEPVAHLGPGDVVGVIATLHGRRSLTTVLATTPVEVLVFDPRGLEQLLDAVPRVAQRLLTAVTRPLAQPAPPLSGLAVGA